MVIRLGIIGLSTDPSAWASITHVKPLTKSLSDQYKLTAVCTSSMKTATAAAKAFGLPEDKAYDSAEAIANDPDVDMVTVSVKLPMHYKLALPILKAKKSTFIEWPLAATTSQAEELAKVAREEGVRNVVCLQARAAPWTQTAKKIIDSGALGRIVNTSLVGNSSMLLDVKEKYSYFADPKSGASIIAIGVIHTIDPLLYLLGEFKWLSAVLTKDFPEMRWVRSDGSKSEPVPRPIHDSVSIQGVLESGTSVSFSYKTTAKATPDHLEWIICGEKASLKFEANHTMIQGSNISLSIYEPSEESDPEHPTEWRPVDVPPNLAWGGVGEVYKAFAENDTKPLVDFEEAVKRHHMIDALFRSDERGTRESYL